LWRRHTWWLQRGIDGTYVCGGAYDGYKMNPDGTAHFVEERMITKEIQMLMLQVGVSASSRQAL
jgi:hypothetical protein